MLVLWCNTVLNGCHHFRFIENQTFVLAFARKKEENPLWHAIHAHSWSGVTMWAKRVAGKWDYKIAQVIKSGQAPAVKSPVTASQYRDSGKELEVFQMCQTMSYYDEHFKKNLPPHQYDMVMEQFLTGRLDAKILPAVLAKRKDFRPAEFSFLLLENQDSMESLDFLSLGSSDQQEKLQKLHKQLCVEQAAWRTHLAKLKAHEDAALGDFNQQVMRQQDALDEAWKEQKTLNLQIHVSDSCSAGALLVSQARTIASEHFSGSLQSSQCSQSGVSGVPVVYEWNFPKAGRASRIVKEVVPIIAQTCSSDPKMVIHIVVPPCQPMFGKGEAVGDERAESIAQNVDRLCMELTNPSNGLCVRKVVGLWDADTFYSHDRDLGFEYWLVVSDSCRAKAKTGVFNHIFGNSVLMKRGAFPTMMKAMERRDFANWKQPLGFGDQKHPTSGHENYQWFSGVQLFGAVLGDLIKGSILTQNHVLVVVDGCQSLLGAELQAGQLSAQSNLCWLELDPGEGPHQAGGSGD